MAIGQPVEKEDTRVMTPDSAEKGVLSEEDVSDGPIYDSYRTFDDDEKEYARIVKEMKRNKIKVNAKTL